MTHTIHDQHNPEGNKEIYAQVYHLYIQDKRKFNLHRMSKEYGVPYSSLRRAVMNLIRLNHSEDTVTEMTLPVHGFEHLQPGDTYQFAETMTLWLVLRRDLADMEDVWLLKPEPQRRRGQRHWILDRMVGA